MIYHFLSSGNYTNNFISFLKRNISEEEFVEEHQIIINSSRQFKNTFSIFYQIIKFRFLLKNNDRVILHGYADPFMYLLCILSFFRLKQFSWVIWGGDLYFYNEKKSFKYKIYEFARLLTIKRFGYFITNLKGDFFLAQKFYKVNGKHLFAFYPISLGSHNESKILNKKQVLKILVGNSTDPSNNHKEILNILSKFKNEEIEIYCVLSYGNFISYREEVIRYGKMVFNEKFIPVLTYMNNHDYNKFIDQIDILVLYHNRQQAVGNIVYFLHSKKKVFIKQGISTCSFLDDQGISYFFTDTIHELSIDEFSYMEDFQRENNKRIINSLYSEKNLTKVWQDVFDTIKS